MIHGPVTSRQFAPEVFAQELALVSCQRPPRGLSLAARLLPSLADLVSSNVAFVSNVVS